MVIDAPYLSARQIEREADLLLAEYARSRAAAVLPPIPVEEILEGHLGLCLDFDDLRTRTGDDNALGALYPETKRVSVDERLDPTNAPDVLGRFRFTIAHEVGHWILHRKLLERHARQTGLILDISPAPAIVCSAGEVKRVSDRQADVFASSLLMPRAVLLDVWRARNNGLAPRCTSDQDGELALKWAKELGSVFDVSTTAMRIRLEEVGIVRLSSEQSCLFD